MKWTKLELDPETAPRGFTLWYIPQKMRRTDKLFFNPHNTWFGYYSFQIGVSNYYLDLDGTRFTTEELIALNAHWIYPQDLEMPE